MLLGKPGNKDVNLLRVVLTEGGNLGGGGGGGVTSTALRV